MRVLPLWFTQADYSKAFLKAHREKITLHKAAPESCDKPSGAIFVFRHLSDSGKVW